MQNPHEQSHGDNESADTRSSSEHEQYSAATEPQHNDSSSQHAAGQGGTPDNTDDGFEMNKLFGILGYILPFLFFLPLVNDKTKHDPFSRFHANQQLILLIVIVLIYMVHNMFFMMWVYMGPFMLLTNILNVIVLVYVVLGVINVVKGEQKKLPLIGGFKLI